MSRQRECEAGARTHPRSESFAILRFTRASPRPSPFATGTNPKAKTVLSESFAQHVLFDAPARTAPGQLAVNHDRRHAADAMLRGTARNLLLMHIMHHDFVFRASQLLHGFDGVFAGFATGAENFNFVF